jgi:hypothetical protein
MRFNLFPVHAAGAQGPDQNVLASPPDRKNNEEMAALRCDANGAETLFRKRMFDVGSDKWRSAKKTFDLRLRNSVFPAFVPIAMIPVEAVKLH